MKKMKTKNEIIKLIYQEKQVITAIKKIASKNSYDPADSISEIFGILLEYKDDEFWNNLYENNTYLFFILRITMNQFASNNSQMNKKYKLSNNVIELNFNEKMVQPSVHDEYEFLEQEMKQEAKLQSIEREIKKLDWYGQLLLKEYYYNNKTIQQLHKETKIPRSSIHKTISDCRKIIRKNLNVLDNN